MPFTVDRFFAVFREYNLAVWPVQFVFFALACFAVYVAALPSRTYDRIACAILSFLWLWMAFAYHLAFFWKINPAAPLFAAGFIAQGALLWWFGVKRGSLTLQLRNDAAGWIGGAAIVYAVIAYPIATAMYGHVFPDAPTFGLPCPTTIFTFGLLLWARPAVPRGLLIVPSLWALFGASAAASLGMPPDYGLPVVALAALAVALAQVRPHPRLA